MQKLQNHMIIIFGGTGDLTKRKLMPALYKLYTREILTEKMPILCIARSRLSKQEYLEHLQPEEFISDYDEKAFTSFSRQIHYHSLDLDKDSGNELKKTVDDLNKSYTCGCNKMFYFATPPDLFDEITEVLEKNGIVKEKGWNKVVYEKPFGRDLLSAQKLQRCISSVFDEKDIYRIDHYLGKELIQNIIVFRFANAIFKEIWNRKFIDHVQITVSEKVGVEKRAGYYEKSGSIRDMVQNHLMQILSLVAMEEPKDLQPDSIRDEKVRVLKSLRPISEDDYAIGQYGPGKLDNNEVPGYREEENTDPGSMTPTFTALRVRIENDTWKGVPFFIRTGKRLAKKYSVVNLCLKGTSTPLFGKVKDNLINIRIQPDEGISIRFNGKFPGKEIRPHPVEMDFCHKCLFEYNTPEAYENLLEMIMLGDQSLFPRWDEVEASWRFIGPLLKMVEKNKQEFPNYAPGSMGPKESDELLKKTGHSWIQ